MSAHYRKKPVVIEAYEFQNRVGADTRPAWMLDAVEAGTIKFHNVRHGLPYLTVKTLEGDMTAQTGDWIIRGVAGEIYPCKPDIFAMTYDPIEAPSLPTEPVKGLDREEIAQIAHRIDLQVMATRGYLIDNKIDPHFADILLSHYTDFARELRALAKADQTLALRGDQGSAVAESGGTASPKSEGPISAGSAWPKRGDQMTFMNRNGYDSEREAAAKVFAIGRPLTVIRCEVGSWSHSVWFDEDPTRGWNGVMFEMVGAPERYPLPAKSGVGEPSEASTAALATDEINTSAPNQQHGGTEP